MFYHEQIDDADASRVDYCTTDQVRFERIGDRSRTAVALTEVPATVFSEAMRDVDLFVGVTSIATDPTWYDHGTDRHIEYWQRVAFGELGMSGQTRKEAVERLLPRLKIRDRARVVGHYLIVDGHKHTYRIHLGSGNILMSPNDQYLCIVPARSTTPRPCPVRSRSTVTRSCRSCSPRHSCSPTTTASPIRRSSPKSTDGILSISVTWVPRGGYCGIHVESLLTGSAVV